MIDRKSLFKDLKRIVLKLGTRVIMRDDNTLDTALLGRIADEVWALNKGEIEVAIVSSGAIGIGMGRLGLKARPRSIPPLQAAAAVGQNLLMHHYELAFRRRGMPIGQVLLTADDLRDRGRYVNVRNTLNTLFRYKAVPVLNENDSLAVEEIKVGDNDTLSAYVANLIGADLLVVFSDVEGLFSSDPRRGPKPELVKVVTEITPEIEGLAGSAGTEVGIGGMGTKIKAAKIVTGSGEMMIIVDGKRTSLLDIVDGAEAGTLFLPTSRRMTGRKRWIAFTPDKKGAVTVDDGAARAIVEGGKSLLPSGIVGVRGAFEVGEMIGIEDRSGVELARGLVRYSSEEVSRICGRKSAEIEEVLGYKVSDEIAHRDDLVVL